MSIKLGTKKRSVYYFSFIKLKVSTFLVYKVKKCLLKSGKVKITIFPRNMGFFPEMPPIFPKKAPIFPKYSSLSGKVWGKPCRKMRVFSCLFVNNMRFFLVFPAEHVGFLFFPRNARFFPNTWVFRGSCGKGIVLPLFSQYFCSVEETRQR